MDGSILETTVPVDSQSAMTPTRLRLMAVIGVACLASSVFLVKAHPAPRHAILDSIYN
jgi:hypothetical protein